MKVLETSRLILRGWQKSDANDLFDIMKDEYVSIGGWEPHSSVENSEKVLDEYIERNDRWAIELKDSKKVIGCIRLYPDNNRGKLKAKMINYVLNKDHQGNGYMTEAVKRVVRYVFEDTDTEILSAFHYPENKKSKKVLENCGFKFEITIPHGSVRFDGEIFDSVCYCISKTDCYN